MKKNYTLLSLLLCLGTGIFSTLAAAPGTETETTTTTETGTADVVAARGSLTGVVLDESHHAVPGAVVYIRSLNMGAVAANDGSFSLRGIPEGVYEVCVNYVGYEQVCQSFNIRDNETVRCEFLLHEGVAIGDVVVSGIVEGQRRALTRQKNNDGVSNIVAADQMNRFADANIGDAMKRIPGINVQYDQGEARFGQVRGTAPDLTSVTLNGNRLPSAEGDSRAAQLDLIPTDMIQTIEVNKVVTADMDGDAIGGSVNLVTKSSPYRQTVAANAGLGYNPISERVTFNGSASWGSRFFKDRLGVMAAVAYHNNPIGSDNIEATWKQDDAGNAYVDEFEVRQYYVHRERQSYSLSLDWKFNENHKIELRGMYNRRNDWENRYRLTYKDITPQEDGTATAYLRRQTKGGAPDTKFARLERQQTADIALAGEHNLGWLGVEWGFDYARASEDRPNERYIGLESDEDNPIRFDADLSNEREPRFTPSDASLMELNATNFIKLDELTESFSEIEENEYKAHIDLRARLFTGRFAGTLRGGYKFQDKDKSKLITFYDVEPADEGAFLAEAMGAGNTFNATRKNFYAGDYIAGDFVSKQYLSHLDFNDASQFSLSRNAMEEAENYTGHETIHAAYLRYDQQFGERLKLIAGLRLEHTTFDYTGNALNIDAEEEHITSTPVTRRTDFDNWLPSVLLKYEPVDNLVLRASFTTTLARPKFSQMVPGDRVNLHDEEYTMGNPDLRNTVSNNYDLMCEYYFKSIGLVSAGVYYKQISDFIVDAMVEDQVIGGQEFKELYKAVNAGDATLFGVEVAFQRDLGFISPALKNFGLYTNYTYNHSKVTRLTDPIFAGRDDDEIQLPGTPAHTLNASLYFENKLLTATLSYNYASSFLDNEEMGMTAFTDRYYDSVNYLDANISVRATKNICIFAEVGNLLNQPLRYYQGTRDRVRQAEYYGIRFSAGAKVRF